MLPNAVEDMITKDSVLFQTVQKILLELHKTYSEEAE